MSLPVTPEVRLEILTAVKNGTSVDEVAAKHHVAVSTIKNWMRRGTNNAKSSATELQKAEKKIALLESIVLEFVLEKKALARKG